MDMMAELDIYPDVYNANDWQTALSVVVLKQERNKMKGYSGIATGESRQEAMMANSYCKTQKMKRKYP